MLFPRPPRLLHVHCPNWRPRPRPRKNAFTSERTTSWIGRGNGNTAAIWRAGGARQRRWARLRPPIYIYIYIYMIIYYTLYIAIFNLGQCSRGLFNEQNHTAESQPASQAQQDTTRVPVKNTKLTYAMPCLCAQHMSNATKHRPRPAYSRREPMPLYSVGVDTE